MCAPLVPTVDRAHTQVRPYRLKDGGSFFALSLLPQKGGQTRSRDVPDVGLPGEGVAEEGFAVKLTFTLDCLSRGSRDIRRPINRDGAIGAVVTLEGGSIIFHRTNEIVDVRRRGSRNVTRGEALTDRAAGIIHSNKTSCSVVRTRRNRTGTITGSNGSRIISHKAARKLTVIIIARQAVNVCIRVAITDLAHVIAHTATDSHISSVSIFNE